jgi:hypothetical protein
VKLFAAIGLFVLSLSLALVGVAQRTIWAPPPANVLTLEYDAENHFALIDQKTLSTYPGNPTVTVFGDEKTFVSSARESDIRAWIADSSFTSIQVKDAETLELEPVSNFGLDLSLSPRGSDLWRDEANGKQKAELAVQNEHDAAVLIATDGRSPAPGKVTVSWPIAYDLTPSNINLIVAGVLLAAALVVNLFSVSEERRRRRPQRRVPKAPQGPRTRGRKSNLDIPRRGRRVARKVSVATSGLLVLGLLSGCSPAAAPIDPTPSPSSDVIADPPVLLESQIQKIVSNVAMWAKKADGATDKSMLLTRFEGAAQQMRTTYYYLMSKSTKNEALPPIEERITWSLPASSTIWPRSLMVVTDDEDNNLPQMLVMSQSSPRSQYKVSYVISLVPGAALPPVAAADAGAIPVASDSAYLKVVPRELPPTYGDVIDKGTLSEFYELFDLENDKYYADVSALEKAQVQKLTKAKIKFKHYLGSSKVLSLSTASGGALVAVYMKDDYTIKPIKVGSGVTVSGNEKILLGTAGSVKGVRSTYGNMMIFYVPPLSADEKTTLLGVTQGLLSVKGL